MGTKNNPGSFDCYANAGPDEPMFILLGRDKFASDTVDKWIQFKTLQYDIQYPDGWPQEKVDKLNEAKTCAQNMRDFYCNTH